MPKTIKYTYLLAGRWVISPGSGVWWGVPTEGSGDLLLGRFLLVDWRVSWGFRETICCGRIFVELFCLTGGGRGCKHTKHWSKITSCTTSQWGNSSEPKLPEHVLLSSLFRLAQAAESVVKRMHFNHFTKTFDWKHILTLCSMDLFYINSSDKVMKYMYSSKFSFSHFHTSWFHLHSGFGHRLLWHLSLSLPFLFLSAFLCASLLVQIPSFSVQQGVRGWLKGVLPFYHNPDHASRCASWIS